ncbi:carotenoid biosynthesis protein [Halalkalibacter nanhaiisediminis]|uniref:Putative membrane protein n=1 Tax=Halalkalibacter nanhaiisediminis TaxID=688079 RepID=A0A562QMQ0_9BACI|nr:carotenoid biosynthesis protein [Halalkalibacter nanhaiisediminis]TWI57953.1 putative membrane protein [Halalkalibacter nanhaiisediminis]
MSNRFDRILFRFFLFWYTCGVILLTFDILPPFLEWANAVFLILSGLLGVVYFIRNYGFQLGLFLSLMIFFVTIFIEWIGVQFGLFFGHYYYNPDFGLIFFDVPLTIGFAWLMVISTTHVITKQIVRPIKQPLKQGNMYAFIGALAAVVIDLVIDPVAYLVKEYWIWNGEGFYYGVPFSNFAGWFILAFILHTLVYLILYLRSKWTTEQSTYWTVRMVWLYALMIFMFMILALTNGLIGAAFLTATLTGILLVIYFSIKKGGNHDD